MITRHDDVVLLSLLLVNLAVALGFFFELPDGWLVILPLLALLPLAFATLKHLIAKPLDSSGLAEEVELWLRQQRRK